MGDAIQKHLHLQFHLMVRLGSLIGCASAAEMKLAMLGADKVTYLAAVVQSAARGMGAMDSS